MEEERSIATVRFLDALNYAVQLHGSDTKKGTSIPYAAHILGVCALVLTDGGTEDEAIAALLHDVLEDHPEETNREEIRKRFGPEVLNIVEGCTDTPPDYSGGPKPPWRERKEKYLKHVQQAPPAVRRVALADKLDNIRSMYFDYRSSGESLWSRFNAGKEAQLWFFRNLVSSFRSGGTKGFLMDEFERTVKEFEMSCNSSV